jgi:hypothetical protein
LQTGGHLFAFIGPIDELVDEMPAVHIFGSGTISIDTVDGRFDQSIERADVMIIIVGHLANSFVIGIWRNRAAAKMFLAM